MDLSRRMQKMKPRMCGFKMLLVLSCQLIFGCGRPASLRPCVDKIYDSVGGFDSADNGARAAVRKLSGLSVLDYV
jgi:hypothetical protein